MTSEFNKFPSSVECSIGIRQIFENLFNISAFCFIILLHVKVLIAVSVFIASHNRIVKYHNFLAECLLSLLVTVDLISNFPVSFQFLWFVHYRVILEQKIISQKNSRTGIVRSLELGFFDLSREGSIFPTVIVSLQPRAEFGPNDHLGDAPHFTKHSTLTFSAKPMLQLL